MQTVQPNLFTRPDTFFGICEGLGEDTGIHPNILRVSLAGIMFFYPLVAFAAYAGAGVVVLLTRLIFPAPRSVADRAAATLPIEEATDRAVADDDLELPLAA